MRPAGEHSARLSAAARINFRGTFLHPVRGLWEEVEPRFIIGDENVLMRQAIEQASRRGGRQRHSVYILLELSVGCTGASLQDRRSALC